MAERAYRLPVNGLGSFLEQIRASGRDLRSEVIAAEDVVAPPGVPARMGLAGEVVFRITRLRRVDGVPFAYSMSLLDPQVGHRLDLDELPDRSLYDVLADQLGIVVHRAVESSRAALLGPDDARALHRDEGGAALVSSRLTYDRSDRVVVDDRVIMPGDGVVVATERRVDDVDLTLRFHADDPFAPARSHNQESR